MEGLGARTDKWSCSLDELLQISTELSSTEPPFVCKNSNKHTNKQTNNKKKTFVHSHTLIGKYPGTYTDDLTAEEILGHQSDAYLRSSPKYTIDFIFVILSLGASMLAEL